MTHRSLEHLVRSRCGRIVAALGLVVALGAPGLQPPSPVQASGLPALTVDGQGPALVAYGRSFTDTFRVQNTGSADAGPVVFRFLVPAGSRYVAFADGNATFDACLPHGRLVTCFGSSLAVGDADTLAFTMVDAVSTTVSITSTGYGWWVSAPQIPSMNYGSASALVTTTFLNNTIPTTTTYQAASGSVAPDLAIQMALTGGGTVRLVPAVGPDCYVGMTCGFSGSGLTYTLSDGSSAALATLSGTLAPTGGTQYVVRGQASGVDSTHHAVTVTVQVGLTITCQGGRGGGCVKVFTSGSMSVAR